MQVKASVGYTGVFQALDKKTKQIDSLKSSTLEKIGQQQVIATQERIRNSKTGPDGKPWAPWSMATLKQRIRQGNVNRGLLYRTGALLTSIKYSVKNAVLTIYTDTTYGKYLQFGTPKMPARPFIGWGNQLNTILKQMKDALK